MWQRPNSHSAGTGLPPGKPPNPEKNNLSVDPTCDTYNYDCEIDEQGQCKPKRQREAEQSASEPPRWFRFWRWGLGLRKA